MTSSTALISTGLRSRARIAAFCFFVPKVFPSAFQFQPRDIETSDEGIDFMALTM